MIKFLWRLIAMIAKHQDLDYITAFWFKDSGSMSIVGYCNDKKVCDYFKKEGRKWRNHVQEQ